MDIPDQPTELINVSEICGKKLLLVGHVDYKKSVWALASDLGLRCYVVGTTPKEPVAEQVERYFCYDLDDHTNDQTHCDAIVRWVTSEVGDVDGCLTLYDACVPLAALICARLQKVGIPFHGAMAAQQKGLTFEALSTRDCGLSMYTSRCVSVAREQDLTQASSLVGFPAVLKMEYGGGARGVRQVHSLQESQQHFRYLQQMCETSISNEEGMRKSALGVGFNSHCVLMEFLEGSEHCVDLVAYHGELLLAVVTDKGPQRLPDTFHTVHVMPSLLTPNRLNDVITASWDCCKGLGLSHGVFDVEVMLTSSGPKLIEINPRMGGFGQRDFARHCYNLDFFVMACMVASDIKPQFAGLLSPAEIESSVRRSAPYCESNAPVATQIGNIDENEPNRKIVQRTDDKEGQTTTKTSVVEDTQDSTFPRFKTREKAPVPLPTVPTPRALCFTVGLFLYPLHHGTALKTTARPETLRRLHDQGELLFVRIEEAVIEKTYELPFCIVAVKGHSFEEARATLENVCLRLGIDAPELGKDKWTQAECAHIFLEDRD